ncbi:hypothetical protein BH23BAC1_BH23BAC1_20030 [soil metagenome]
MKKIIYILIAILITNPFQIAAQNKEEAGLSPWGPEDEIGTLN